MKAALLLLFLFFLPLICTAQKISDIPETLIVAGIADRPPLEFLNSQGQTYGILPDFWAAWSEQSGIPILYRLFSEKKARQKVLEGEAHILSSLTPSDEQKKDFLFSSPYYRPEIRIFTLNSERGISSAEELSPLQVGVVRFGPEEAYLGRNMPFLCLRTFPDTDHLAAALSAGEIRAAAGESGEMLFFLGRHAAGGRIRYLSEPLFLMDICAAVAPRNAYLLAELNRGFAGIGAERMQAIVRSHSGISIGHRIPWHLFSIGILLLVLILAALGFWLWNDQLRRKVESATSDLKEKQQQLMDSETALRKSQGNYKQLYKKTFNERELYRSLLSSSADAIVITDMNHQYIYVNPAFSSLFGWKIEELGTESRDFIPEEEAEQHRRMFRDILDNNTSYHGVSGKCISKGGQIIEVSISASRYNDHEKKPAGILTIFRDMSETRKLENRLRQAQKMEAIGTLAGGIAHDFNNILSAIVGYTEIARLNLPESDKAGDSLDKVLKAGNRARELIRQILSFSRQEQGVLRPTRIAPIIKEVLKLIRASLPATIRIEHHFESNLKYVNADPVEIHQILMNLCTNAHHAMRQKGGILRVTLEAQETAAPSSVYPGMKAGTYQQITVSDTGHGIGKAIMERIFDPYFTTKSRNEGTGIGLSVVHGIVERHRGSIAVESQPGKGTVFRICLPQMESDPEEESEENTGFCDTGTECILLVDDEQFLTDIGREILSGMGYRVITANDSSEALMIFSQSPEQFDIVVTDMTMPGMTGTELAAAIFRIRPDIPLILCTGYSESVTADMAGKMGIRDFFMKPVNYYDLARSVRKLCNEN